MSELRIVGYIVVCVVGECGRFRKNWNRRLESKAGATDRKRANKRERDRGREKWVDRAKQWLNVWDK